MTGTKRIAEVLAVNLPPHLREKVRQATREGGYLNESEFAREAIREALTKTKGAEGSV